MVTKEQKQVHKTLVYNPIKINDLRKPGKTGNSTVGNYFDLEGSMLLAIPGTMFRPILVLTTGYVAFQMEPWQPFRPLALRVKILTLLEEEQDTIIMNGIPGDPFPPTELKQTMWLALHCSIR